MNLFKLETKKINWRGYFLANFIIILTCLFISMMLVFVPFINITITSTNVFDNFTSFYLIITYLFVLFYTIFGSVLHSRITVEEYLGKRSTLLFSYPFSRSKILYIKTALVILFTSISYIILSTLTLIMFAILSIFVTFPVPFTLTELPTFMFLTVLGIIISSLAGIVSMRVGFWKKSLIAPIITSVILITPLNNLTQFIGSASIYIVIAFSMILFIGAIIIMIRLSKKVNTMEVLS